jgi:hypothetical protein
VKYVLTTRTGARKSLALPRKLVGRIVQPHRDQRVISCWTDGLLLQNMYWEVKNVGF